MRIHEKESDLLSTVQEGISSIRLVQAFNRHSFEINQFQRHAERSLQANLQLNVTTVLSALVVGMFMAAGARSCILRWVA